MLLAVELWAADPRAPAAPAAPLPKPAKAHLDRGLSLYEAGRYDEAIAEFESGYALSPHPSFLYAMGQSARRQGNCRAAVGYYERWLAVMAGSEQAPLVQLQVERCREKLAAEQAAVRAAGAARAPPAAGPTSDVPAVRTRPRAWYRDAVGDTLAAVGLAALATGTVLYVRARLELADAGSSYDHYVTALGARDDGAIGRALMIGGGSLLVAGLVRFWLISERSSGVPAIAPAALDHGAALLLSGRF
jgi:tetratricopeptide (TPR) repeat protein